MNTSASAFIALLQQKGLKHDVDERNDDTVVSAGFDMDNASMRVRIFIDDDNKHVALRIFSLCKATPEQFNKAVIACNDCNTEYRWIKFYIDSDNDINASFDITTSDNAADEDIFDAMSRILSISDDVYPKIMKSLWS